MNHPTMADADPNSTRTLRHGSDAVALRDIRSPAEEVLAVRRTPDPPVIGGRSIAADDSQRAAPGRLADSLEDTEEPLLVRPRLGEWSDVAIVVLSELGPGEVCREVAHLPARPVIELHRAQIAYGLATKVVFRLPRRRWMSTASSTFTPTTGKTFASRRDQTTGVSSAPMWKAA